jgi:K+-sensing histidine kinase KdpD
LKKIPKKLILQEGKLVIMQSYHATPDRSEIDEILNDYELFQDSVTHYEFVDNIQIPTMILNEGRQVIFCNKTLTSLLQVKDIAEVLGKRPGEILGCVNVADAPAGCGTNKACTVCGAVNTIVQAQRTKEICTGECLVTTMAEIGTNSGEFEVTASPIIVNQKYFYVFSLIDNSEEKRRAALERTFFHDLMNTAGGLSGVVNVMKEQNNTSCKDMLTMIDTISKNLLEEVQAQKDLVAAEKGNLVLKAEFVESNRVIGDVIIGMENHQVANKKHLLLSPDSQNTTIQTDQRLLKRILTNMVKNALEAEDAGASVKVLSRQENDGTMSFIVQNPKVIPQEIQYQIFQRSFSTKGSGRGLGTYSMKMLGEVYLKGKVYFKSNSEIGTMFICNIPVVIE